MQIIVCPMLVFPSIFEISRNEHTWQLSIIKIVKGENTNWHSVFFLPWEAHIWEFIMHVVDVPCWSLAPLHFRLYGAKLWRRRNESAKKRRQKWEGEEAILLSFLRLRNFGLAPNSTLINRRRQKCEVAKMRVRSYEGEGGKVVSFLRHCNFAFSPTNLQRFAVAS